MLDICREALATQIGLIADPLYSNVRVWKNCSAQYTVGHADRVATIENTLQDSWSGRLSVTGASYHGVGVNDCILSATKLADELVKSGRV